jgi:hypothetical protein
MGTNKNLVFLIIVAVILTIIAFKVNLSSKQENYLTSFATSGNVTSGKINLTVELGVIINFTTDVIDWGTGRVDAGANNATLDTSRSTSETKVANGNWTGSFGNRTKGLLLENIGNLNATLYIKTGKNATTFIGGNNPAYELNVTNNESSSCGQNESTTGNSSNALNFTLGLYYTVNTTGDGARICDWFNFEDTKDALRLDILLRVPASSNTGNLEDTITATAYASS